MDAAERLKRICSRHGKNLKIRASMLLLVPVLVFWAAGPGLSAADPSSPTRVIVDKIGRKVRIAQTPKKVACLFGPSYEKLFAFGAADRISMVAKVLCPWSIKLNPALKDIPEMDNLTAPDVEQLINLKTDLVIYHPFVKQIDQMSASGLAVVVPYDGKQRPTSLQDFFNDNDAQIRFYGELLGGPAEKIAADYCAYTKQRLHKVLEITKRLTATERPKVFYYCGPPHAASSTQTRFSTAYWLVEAAGGTMQTHDDPAYYVTVSPEQMILWNPDFIIVSTLPSIDPIVNNPHWQKVTAVRKNNVIMSPEGVFYWSHFSTESFLAILFMAKLFHPDRFPDLDVTRELKNYYTRFYHYDLTDDEAERIMKHLPPKGLQHRSPSFSFGKR